MDVIRLIASDLDATLLDDQSRLPPDFAETVRARAGRGSRFAAASGRPIYTLEEMFASLQDDIIFVGDNGGAICWKGESLYLSEMDVADWHTLAGQRRRPLRAGNGLCGGAVPAIRQGLQEILHQGGICPSSGGRDRPGG